VNRYAPDVPFPPYTYVPGQAPHPQSDPAGHSYGRRDPPPPAIRDADWPQSVAYLHAVDLFNHGYYWEAHEAWESLWHAAGRRGPIADLLKGLIKLAAAGVKAREGRPTGVKSHTRRAAELFHEAQADGGDTMLGLRLEELATQAETIAKSDSPTVAIELVLSTPY
jgi:uncharacterized protein